jgi:hypothetical protein
MSYERDITNLLRVRHSWLGPCPAYDTVCLNCEAAREIENLRKKITELDKEVDDLKAWALIGLWETAFGTGNNADYARDCWYNIVGTELDGRA